MQSREAAVAPTWPVTALSWRRCRAPSPASSACLALLRARLARARMLLARQLVTNYEQSKPNLVAVVLESNGFKDLLDQLTFLRDASNSSRRSSALTRAAKARADAAAHRLAALRATDREITIATAQRVRALAGMNLSLHSKQAAALARARWPAERAAAASRARGGRLQARDRPHRGGAGRGGSGRGSRAGRRQPERADARRPHLDRAAAGRSPRPIGLCESGGQNLTPNSAGASGYYRSCRAPGSCSAAPARPLIWPARARQDAVASRIWNGGSGASNWVCAGIVGIH